MSKSRTMIIGWDGATFDLILPWVRAGHLPNLARLMEEGAHGPLPAWPSMNSAAAWTSIVTGCNPGQHGVYDFGDAPPQRGQRWRPKTGADRGRDAFWKLLSANGQRVGVLNVPVSYPADLVNGFMLSGMDAPGTNSPGFCHPPSLLDELRRAGIDYVLDVPNLSMVQQLQPHRMPPVVTRMVESRARAMLHLMQHHPWDVMMTVFVATDRMQHHFWSDEPITGESPGWAALLELYRLLDAYLGEAVQQAGSDTTVLVISDHGFGPSRGGKRCLNRMMARLGMLQFHQRGGRLGGRLLRNALRHGRRMVPAGLQLTLARAFPRLWIQAVSERKFEAIDWGRTQAYADGQTCRLSINLQGRQPEGIVTPGEYPALRERLRQILLDLTDPVSGRKVVRRVCAREELYHGPYLDEAADLAFEWNDETLGNSLGYHNDGDPIVVEDRSQNSRAWKAGHRSEGILVAWGPNVRRGARLERATQYGVVPTLLYLQGLPVPDGMDGAILGEMFPDDFLSRNPVRTGAPAVPAQGGPSRERALDEAEERQIEQRLRDLGYLE